MQSILNEVNRLEEGYELLELLVAAIRRCIAAVEAGEEVISSAAFFQATVNVARSFLAKYNQEAAGRENA